VRGFEADRAARGVIASRGYGDRFFHRTGHSIGATHVHGDGANLDDFETHDTRALVPGTCFSIEPGVYLDEFGVRSEIDVFLAADGPKVFSPIQRELVRILG
jgi:Xaa-Pro aminopeptidase